MPRAVAQVTAGGESIVPTTPDGPDTIIIETAGTMFGVSEISSESSSETLSGSTTRTAARGTSRQEGRTDTHGETETSNRGWSEAFEPVMEKAVTAVYDMEKLRYIRGRQSQHPRQVGVWRHEHDGRQRNCRRMYEIRP